MDQEAFKGFLLILTVDYNVYVFNLLIDITVWRFFHRQF